MSNDVLQAVPLFMLMGYVMERAGIMDRMFHSYRLLFGPLPGAIALTTMVVGTAPSSWRRGPLLRLARLAFLSRQV
jgi:TRAP-type mannitol/chloroaromatic compound transport system permease large subunit